MTKQEFDEMAALVVRLRKDVELHTDALRQSNAHCGKLLVKNEDLQSQITSVTKELEYARKAISALDQLDKNITAASAHHGRRAGESVSSFIERTVAERDKIHSELVEVRAALASATEQRDSLQRTLDEWSNADTEPHEKLDPMSVDFRPDPAPAFMMRVQFSATPPVTVSDVADHVVPPVLPMCTTCHGCGMPLGKNANVPYYWCQNVQCTKKTTQYQDCDASPYWGPCNSKTPVRHE